MKKIKYYITLILLFTAIGACDNDEFFDLTNPPEDPWLNLEEFERAPSGAYHMAFTRSNWDNLIGGPRLVKTTQSDLAQLLSGSIGNIPFNEMYNRTSNLEINKTSNTFRNSYRLIAICNSGLDFMAENEGDPFPNISQTDKDHNLRRIEGELHFMRGYAYWLLSTIFLPPYVAGAGNDEKILPLRISFQDNFAGAKSPEIGTTQQIYDLMLDDFSTARQLLPERFDPALHHPSYAFGRANRFAAAAMLARIYFMTGNTTEALAELDYVIDQNGGDYDLTEDPIEAFNRDDNTQGKEVIWYALYFDPVARRNARELSSINLQHYNAENGGNPPDGFKRVSWNQFTLSYAVLKQINWMVDPEGGDYTLTDEALNDKRFQQLYRKLEGYNPDGDPWLFETVLSEVNTPMVWSDKYYRGKGIGSLTNIPVIRLAEMYLTRSLLRFRAGDMAGATADLNIIRNRADIGDLPHAITEQDIHIERIKELAFEGDRTDYLRSAGLDIPPGDRNIATVPYNDPSLIWAVPQSELDLNLGYSDRE